MSTTNSRSASPAELGAEELARGLHAVLNLS